MKGKTSTILLIFLFIVGLSVLLYPTISNYWNTRTQTQAVADYDAKVKDTSEVEIRKHLQDAQEYNKRLAAIPYAMLNHEKAEGYSSLLNISGNGMMGYLNIEKIGVELPIYHGTEKSVLDIAVGHLEGSSLPIGGSSTHCMLSAHRGLPTAKLFTDLDKMQVGDMFTIKVLDKLITYEVDLIRIVEPHETNKLGIVKGEDYCTLITCTPYGINTHRLLVRGRRVDNIQQKTIYISTDAYQVDILIVTPIVAAPMLTALMISFAIKDKKQRRAKVSGGNDTPGDKSNTEKKKSKRKETGL